MLELIAKDLKGYKECTRKNKCGDDEFDFSVYYATPEFVSVHLYEEFCGASCRVKITPVNFDLEVGRPLENLSEPFRPGSGYLRAIASYCIGELKHTWICGDGGTEDEWFRNGSSAKADNYSIWKLSQNDVGIVFQQYQLGSGTCGGASVVVPYSRLRGISRWDVG